MGHDRTINAISIAGLARSFVPILPCQPRNSIMEQASSFALPWTHTADSLAGKLRRVQQVPRSAALLPMNQLGPVILTCREELTYIPKLL